MKIRVSKIIGGSNMKPRINTNSTILLISSIISFFLLIIILSQVNTNLVKAIDIDKSETDILDYIIGFGHLFILIFNVYAIIFVFSHFRQFKELRVLKIIVLILGVISVISFGIEKVMIDEIARQYRFGMDISEINILNMAYIINLVFTLLMFFFVMKTFPILKLNTSVKKLADERIFTIAQYMGILSGAMGLILVLNLSKSEIIEKKIVLYVPYFILFLIPYALAVLYWFSLKLDQKISDWYDEKQLQDIMKASITTLILSFPGLLLFLFLGIPSILFFFLYYIFLVLILFSGSTLFYNKS
jgi:hypothetical protein